MEGGRTRSERGGQTVFSGSICCVEGFRRLLPETVKGKTISSKAKEELERKFVGGGNQGGSLGLRNGQKSRPEWIQLPFLSGMLEISERGSCGSL